ncbi:MAG: hypothetical protein JZU65_12995, partial [Chlorobium sp.]|nr:hypothetical protein [Chlorobium sp.]
QHVSNVCALVQLFSFVHFLLYRSCFTLIEPTNEDWAFDMFQSLNATGTPLTAIETFKPLVVNLANNEIGGYKSSIIETYFKYVDDLLGKLTTAAQKNKTTNEYLVALALTEDGTKLPNQFSAQRKWLTNRYTTVFSSSAEREGFVQRMSNLAEYWQNVIDYDPNEVSYIKKISSASEEDKKIASVCVLFLKDSGHKMAHTILSRFYAHVLRADEGAVDNFVSGNKSLQSLPFLI